MLQLAAAPLPFFKKRRAEPPNPTAPRPVAPPTPLARRPLTAEEQQLVADNLGLAKWFVSRFYGANHRLGDDLVSEAGLALMNAARGYDATRGAFSTYAILRMRAHVQHFVRRQRRHARHVPFVSADDISDGMPGAPEPADPSDPLAEMIDGEHGDAMAAALAKALYPREAAIVLRRANGEPLGAIAADFGLSRQRVQQIEAKSLRRARAAVAPLLMGA